MKTDLKTTLLKKISSAASQCVDVGTAQRETRTSPKGSEVYHIWNERLRELVKKDVSKLTFWEALDERYRYIYDKKTQKLLEDHIVKTSDSVELHSAKDAFRACYLMRDINKD